MKVLVFYKYGNGFMVIVNHHVPVWWSSVLVRCDPDKVFPTWLLVITQSGPKWTLLTLVWGRVLVGSASAAWDSRPTDRPTDRPTAPGYKVNQPLQNANASVVVVVHWKACAYVRRYLGGSNSLSESWQFSLFQKRRVDTKRVDIKYRLPVYIILCHFTPVRKGRKHISNAPRRSRQSAGHRLALGDRYFPKWKV